MENQKEIWDNEYKLNKDKWKKESAYIPLMMKDAIVLELGVGNGKTLKSIIRQKPKKVYAVDFSSEAIGHCKDSFKAEKVSFNEMNIIKLDFENEMFDAVVCNYVLNNLAKNERIKAANEIYRVLKNNGMLLFEDFGAGDFRQKGIKCKEKNSIIKKNGIICHFFEKKEVKELFFEFRINNVDVKTSFPLRGRKDIERVIIRGTFGK